MNETYYFGYSSESRFIFILPRHLSLDTKGVFAYSFDFHIFVVWQLSDPWLKISSFSFNHITESETAVPTRNIKGLG